MLLQRIMMLRRMSCHVSLIALLAAFTIGVSDVRGDGLQDNIPANVRRIPAPGIDVPPERAQSLRAALQQLQQKLSDLQADRSAVTSSLLPDVMIFERAVRCALEYNEFFDARDVDRAAELLQEGLRRAELLQSGKPDWPYQTGLIVRGYISRIDNTVQPYGLVIPPAINATSGLPVRCDIWFHGRGEKLSEVNFLGDRMKNPGEFSPADTIVLHPYGRYCNAFKFAGEIDVLEALEDVRKRYRIDEDRVSVRGFSMGGAACWQFATHYADRWFAANPGAGFSETPQFLKVFQKEQLQPMPWEQTLWNLYDCDKWAGNLFHCPTIAYSGENDSQKQAADVMEQALADCSIRLRHVIGKNMGHRYDAPSKAIVAQSLDELAERGRDTVPDVLKFRTMTLRYNTMHWARVDGLLEHWKPAQLNVRVDRNPDDPRQSAVCLIETANVSGFTLTFPAGYFPQRPEAIAARRKLGLAGDLAVRLQSAEDAGRGDDPASASRDRGLNVDLAPQGPYSDGSMTITAHRTVDGKWAAGPDPAALRKRHNLQGPIDDAFMDSFVFVRPSGTSSHPAVAQWVKSEQERAVEHWRRHFRGDARVVDDSELTDEMIASSNIVLWGDPASNAVMQKIAGQLPIQWTANEIRVGTKTYDAAQHIPVLIYPNPLNPERYVVFNSSFTFRDYAYLNNARQVPMLPDWAIVDLNTPPNSIWPGKIVAADFFDEQWQLKPAGE